MTVRERSKRDQTHIIFDILTSVQQNEKEEKGLTKTRIMNLSNLNVIVFNKYFSVLLEEGLIQEVIGDKGQIIYRITDKGKLYRQSIEISKKLEERLVSLKFRNSIQHDSIN